MAKVTITYKGKLFKGVGRLFKQAMINSTIKITEVVQNTARDTLASKKISDPKRGGPLFNSIVYDIKAPVGTEVRGKVIAEASHAIYVEEDRRLRNGKLWSQVNTNAPYKYMEAGAIKGNQEAVEIVINEFNKIM